jgi:hypothetical protein
MKYRVTWTVEVDAEDDDAARVAARQFVLDHEDEALAKIVPVEEGSSPREVPHVRASGGR